MCMYLWKKKTFLPKWLHWIYTSLKSTRDRVDLVKPHESSCQCFPLCCPHGTNMTHMMPAWPRTDGHIKATQVHNQLVNITPDPRWNSLLVNLLPYTKHFRVPHWRAEWLSQRDVMLYASMLFWNIYWMNVYSQCWIHKPLQCTMSLQLISMWINTGSRIMPISISSFSNHTHLLQEMFL